MREEKQESEQLTPKVLYEDEYLLVLDKPSGFIVNEAETTKNQPTIQQYLISNFQYPISKDKLFRSGIVHRLDKETSGCLIVAKTRESFENLQNQFKERQIQKKYIALTHGKIADSEGVINAEVGRLPWRRDRFGILAGGRESETRYKVIKYYSQVTDHKSLFTLVECYPKTGRTHQIRIHLKHIGNPIVSDTFYAGRKTSRRDRQWCKRLFLHASEIKFTHPHTGKEILVSSPLAADLKQVLANLESQAI